MFIMNLQRNPQYSRFATLGLVMLAVGAFLYGPTTPCRGQAQSEPSLAATGSPANPLPAPRLHLEKEEWDFGTKWYGETCSTEIAISNLGTAPLKIIKIHSSCGCTAAVPNRNEIPPGESDRLVITYNTKKAKENVAQTLTLETNDPERPRTPIKVVGVIKKVFDILPNERITFGTIERNEAAEISVELRSNMDHPVPLKLRPLADRAPFSVNLEELEPGKLYKLTAATKPPLKLGANAIEAVLETGLEQFPTIVVPVSVYIAPRIYARPAKLFLSPAVSRSFTRSVRVYHKADEPLEILEVKISHPELISVERLPKPSGDNAKGLTSYYELRVTLPPGNQLPPEGAKIEIHTSDSDPEYRMIIIDVVLRQAAARPIEDLERDESPKDQDPAAKSDD